MIMDIFHWVLIIVIADALDMAFVYMQPQVQLVAQASYQIQRGGAGSILGFFPGATVEGQAAALKTKRYYQIIG